MLKPTSPVSFFHRFVIASALAVQQQKDEYSDSQCVNYVSYLYNYVTLTL